MLQCKSCSHKSGFFECEAHRALVCCSDPREFKHCVNTVALLLENSGYPRPVAPAYDGPRKMLLLKDIFHEKERATQPDLVTLVLTFQIELLELGLHTLWSQHAEQVLPFLGFRVAWKVKPNLLRKMYRLNWPVQARVHGTGFGWEGSFLIRIS